MSQDTRPIRIAEALEGALTRALNRLAPDLPELVWQLRGRNIIGMPGFDGDEAADVAARWAEHLGLDASGGRHEGSIEYAGAVDGVPVIVWAVTDREVWEQSNGERRYYGEVSPDG